MFTRLWWHSFSTSNYLTVHCLYISFYFLEEKNKWCFQWIQQMYRLSLGKARYVFCLILCKWGVSFQLDKAYSILQEDYQASRQDHHAHNTIPQEVWNLVWKVKIPLKIGIFVWKDMHDSIPTFLNLCNRGINVHSTCPLCNSKDESTTHLFLYCPFALAWFIIGYSYFCAK